MKKTGYICVLTAAAMLSGCSAASVKELLSPPRLNEEQSQIYDALKSAAKSDITLKYPKSGQYRSAFVVKDIDDEPTDEAFVFYETPNINDGSSLRINFLDKENGRWFSVYDLAAEGNEVEKVMFSDLGNGKNSVVVTFLIQNSSDKSTSIIEYNGKPEEVFACRSSYADVIDINGDGTDELFTVTSDKASGISEAGLYAFSGDNFTELGSASLENVPAEYKNVVCGSYDGYGSRAVFIDYSLSDGENKTAAVIFNGNRLISAQNTDIISRRSNSYTPSLYSFDSDGDGRIEIPSNVPFPSYEAMSRSEQVNMTVWYSIGNDGCINEKFRSFVGTKGDYMLKFPEEMNGNITASVSIAESSASFRSYKNGKDGDLLFRIYGASDSKKYADSGYAYLGESSAAGWFYYAEIPDKSPIKENDIRKMFAAF